MDTHPYILPQIHFRQASYSLYMAETLLSWGFFGRKEAEKSRTAIETGKYHLHSAKEFSHFNCCPYHEIYIVL